ncbi:MAG: hypothetical protein COT74_02105 [Bdellovibrionales bacterium CG10_big_fil_rev_8_21_14_0_10_45_34]|nr:MAG: hypothetical protein COT74_02105 [Bdellovibrionales bacterium CG10_big_fil_rev_8_21_14_0_10_45_34]
MSAHKGSYHLNLVPFIDLFSTLVIFLLTTAVWTHINALSTNVDSISSTDTPMNQPQEKKVVLSITIFPDRVEFAEDEKTYPIISPSGEIDDSKLLLGIENWRTRFPDKKDIILNTQNDVQYRHLIKVFDTLVGNGFPDVGVNTQ